jgi:GH35 family endo-1,4-beta-xylanase
MKKNLHWFKFVVLATALAGLIACQDGGGGGGGGPVKSISLPKYTIMTLYQTQKLVPTFDPPDPDNKKVTWTSSDPSVVSVSEDGTAKALTVGNNGTVRSSVLTATSEDGGFTATTTVTVTMIPQELATSVTPLKEAFKDYFMMGNVFSSYDMNADRTKIKNDYIPYHYNFLTFENEMKPGYLNGAAPGEYNEEGIALAKKMITAAKAQGVEKIHGHVIIYGGLSWNNNNFFTDKTNDEVLGYLREVVGHIAGEFKGYVYSWDVMNESISGNPTPETDWRTVVRNAFATKLGAETYVYEAFLAARNADPGAILYYNDYNLEVSIAKATMAANMARDINARYAAEHPEAGGRKLIEGYGIQGHVNAGDLTQNPETQEWSYPNFVAALEQARGLGMKVAISEFDLLALTYNEWQANRNAGNVLAVTHANRLRQAEQYKVLTKILIDNADIIERVTFWGNSDVGLAEDGRDMAGGMNNSNGSHWRWEAEPIPFNRVPEQTGPLKVKPCYYKILEALE